MKESKSFTAMLIVGNLAKDSTTRRVMHYAHEILLKQNCAVDFFDCAEESLPLFNVETSFSSASFHSLQKRVQAADVFVLGTPDYHGSMSSAMKNFLDHFWKEYAGKLFVSIVGSYEKGLTVHDQIRTIARQCYAWSLPYGISFDEKIDFAENQIAHTLQKRIHMMVNDVLRYGRLLSEQRKKDMNSTYEGFLAHYRTSQK